jgi:hypothetical protein
VLKISGFIIEKQMTATMQKNYSHCPLKKRPVFIVKEGKQSMIIMMMKMMMVYDYCTLEKFL